MNEPSLKTTKMEIQDLPLWEKIRGKRIPLSFDLEITARCNLNCRHCYINLPAGDAKVKAAELLAEEIFDIARQAVKLGSVWCLITGGEPMLRKDFEEIYIGLKRLGLLLSVFTNATLISDSHIELFSKYPPRDIEVTVYGVTAATYDHISRQKGSFQRFITGLNLLQNSGIRTRLKAMAIQSNLHEQAAISAFCRERTKDYFRFDPVLHLRFDGNPVRNSEILAERLTPEQVVALEEADHRRSSALLEKCDLLINEKRAGNQSDLLFGCGAGKGTFNISYDGRFRLCSSLWAPETTYDLRKNSLEAAWKDFVPQVLSKRSRRPEFLEKCRKCPIINLCLWCPAHAHLETGELDCFTPYFCAVAHQRAEQIRKSVKREQPELGCSHAD